MLHEKDILTYFLVCEGLSTDDVGVEKDTVFQKIRLWAGFKTGDFVQEKLGGGGYRGMTRRKEMNAWVGVHSFLSGIVTRGGLYYLVQI